MGDNIIMNIFKDRNKNHPCNNCELLIFDKSHALCELFCKSDITWSSLSGGIIGWCLAIPPNKQKMLLLPKQTPKRLFDKMVFDGEYRNERELFYDLYIYQDMKIKEVANYLTVSYGTVRKRLRELGIKKR